MKVSDLTWEQKEQVLRELFIRMNTRKSSMTDSTTNAYVFNPLKPNVPSKGHLNNCDKKSDKTSNIETNIFLD